MKKTLKVELYSITIGLVLLMIPTLGLANNSPASQKLFTEYLRTAADCNAASCQPGAYYIKNSADLAKISNGLVGQSQDLQGSSQWSNKHYALLIAPGSYNLTTPRGRSVLGYYTQILGVGSKSDDVAITPGIEVYNQCPAGDDSCPTTGGLNNFWRGLENLKMVNAGVSGFDPLRFAVSQASPLRRIHVTGNLLLCDWQTPSYACGYASGGFMADSTIDQALKPGSQQQWIVRNSTLGASESAIWNMVLVGAGSNPIAPTNNPHQEPDDNQWLNFPITNTATAPIISEKPYVSYDDARQTWNVVVPGLKLDSVGSDLADTIEGTKILDIDSQFFIISPNLGIQDDNGVTHLDSTIIANINDALANGKKNLIIMPGTYQLADAINVSNNDTVILGLGVPTLICGNVTCMNISAEQGVKLGGIIFEAGTQSQVNTALLQVGEAKNENINSSDPDILYDVYVRIAETQADSRSDADFKERTADTGVIIYANNTIGDNLWIWRGDHDKASGTDPDPIKDMVTWQQNPAKHGIVVYGSDVVMYGLAVEHFQDYQTLWYGDGGQVYFYQSEMPYDVPTIADWTCSLPKNTTNPAGIHSGCASYWVSPDVITHAAHGVGVYSYFTQAKINPESGIQAPHGVNMTGIVGRWLGGVSGSGMQYLVADFAGAIQGFSPTDTSADTKTSDIGQYH